MSLRMTLREWRGSLNYTSFTCGGESDRKITFKINAIGDYFKCPFRMNAFFIAEQIYFQIRHYFTMFLKSNMSLSIALRNST